ncbi:N-formylglutamate amidohydrolase [Poseidonocella pacifica]|uniref:N-formylglutamate amidohydrolase n=1 Tax=Poseidonocella pacifica TaxID=871651 RepID=A0A1I0XSW8_9RHOB|nr:N-formylglutamate amidohydrolase [Poseidonocella pacifica]
MTKAAYILHQPRTRQTSVVFSSPHSGCDYPASFLEQSTLDEHSIRSSEDAFVDQLIGSVTDYGAPLLSAVAPRAYLDLNRSAEELDPALIEGVRKLSHNPRVASGLGVIPRVVAGGRAIYSGKITQDEADRRISRHWYPYHERLRQLLTESHALFDEAILVDVHSMPHEAIEGIGRVGAPRPDVVIGDRFGASAGAGIVEQVEQALRGAGLRVARNAPFAGAYIVQTYGRPARNQHALQIEIDRSLYMDEREIRPNENFEEVRALLSGVMAEIAAIGQERLPLAAE